MASSGSVADLLPLPDLLRPDLDIVFVGINPGIESSRQQRYYAHIRNRFWDAANKGGVFAPPLNAQTCHLAIEQGIGFTDIVKRPTPGQSDLNTGDYRDGAPVLLRKLKETAPRIACFNGITPFQYFLRFALGQPARIRVEPGLQAHTVGSTKLFVVPSPSPANAAFSLDNLAGWYGKLTELRRCLAP